MLGQLVYMLTLLKATETAQQHRQSQETLGESPYISFCYKLASFFAVGLKMALTAAHRTFTPIRTLTYNQ